MRILLIVILMVPTIAFQEQTKNPNICVEGFRCYDNKIFVILSEIIPGEYYYEAGIRIPKHKRAWVEVYVAVGNKIVLLKKINLKLIPAQPERWVLEKE